MHPPCDVSAVPDLSCQWPARRGQHPAPARGPAALMRYIHTDRNLIHGCGCCKSYICVFVHVWSSANSSATECNSNCVTAHASCSRGLVQYRHVRARSFSHVHPPLHLTALHRPSPGRRRRNLARTASARRLAQLQNAGPPRCWGGLDKERKALVRVLGK